MKFYITIIFLISFFFCKTQTPEYSQIIQNKLFYNPAFVGTNVCPRIFMSVRNRYVSLDNTYKSYFLSYDQNIYALNFDFGFLLAHDNQADVFKNTKVDVLFAKAIQINKKYTVKAGVEFGLNYEDFTPQQFTYTGMINPIHGFVYDNTTEISDVQGLQFNLAMGILLYSNNFYIGSALYNINQPESRLDGSILYERELHLQTGFEININGRNGFLPDFKLMPAINYMAQNKHKMFNWGTQLLYRNFILGTFIKNSIDFDYDSFVILVGFEQKKYKFAYDCDIPFGEKSSNSVDIHEITLTLYPGCGKNRIRPRAIKCPGI